MIIVATRIGNVANCSRKYIGNVISSVPSAPHSTTFADPTRRQRAEQRDGDELQQAADGGRDEQVLEAEAELLHAVVDRVGVHQRVRADAEERGADGDRDGAGALRNIVRSGTRSRRFSATTSSKTGVSVIDQRR